MPNEPAKPIGFFFQIKDEVPVRSGTKHRLTWNASAWNTTSAKPGNRVTVPASGLWRLDCGVQFEDQSTGRHAPLHLRICRLDGEHTTPLALWDGHRISSTAWTSNHTASAEIPLSIGEQLVCEVTHYDDKTLTLSTAYYGTYLRAKLTNANPH